MKLRSAFAALLLTALPCAIVPAQNSTPAPATHTVPKPAEKAAPGGGPGKVWVNTKSNVYHCSTDRYYGKTKEGKYMTEAEAKAAGAHGVGGKGCS